jgi:RimJ/RimL family protein N-acetyltransferase
VDLRDAGPHTPVGEAAVIGPRTRPYSGPVTTDFADPPVALLPLDPHGADRDDLRAFLTANAFPFHGRTRWTPEEVAAAIADGAFDGEGTQSFWLAHAELGRMRLEDLEDPTPELDLRLAEEFRGRGLGAAALRAVARHVFAHDPRVMRLEGQTREDNLAMRRTFVRCGWVKEAHHREAWPVEGGAPLASVAYAILRRDWESGTTTPVPWEEPAP